MGIDLSLSGKVLALGSLQQSAASLEGVDDAPAATEIGLRAYNLAVRIHGVWIVARNTATPCPPPLPAP